MNGFTICLEATLVGVEVSRELRVAKFALVDVSGVRWHLIAESVNEMLLEEFPLYNIIDKVIAYDLSNPLDQDSVDALYYLMHGVMPGTAGLESDRFRSIINSVKTGEFKLFIVEAVYGAQVFMLAKSMDLLQATQ